MPRNGISLEPVIKTKLWTLAIVYFDILFHVFRSFLVCSYNSKDKQT